jgi:hypothetical protein
MQSTKMCLVVEEVRTQRGSNAKIRKIKGMGTDTNAVPEK